MHIYILYICVYIYIYIYIYIIYVYNSLEALADLFIFRNCQWKSFFYTTLSVTIHSPTAYMLH